MIITEEFCIFAVRPESRVQHLIDLTAKFPKILTLLLAVILQVTPSMAQVLRDRKPSDKLDLFFKDNLTSIISLESRDTVKVIFIGDVMMHSKQLDKDWKMFFRNLEGRFKGADLAVANMEFPLAGKPYTGYPAFSTPDDYPQVIADAGIDVFLGANNHVLDKGSAGLVRTLEIYRSMRSSKGILFTGISSDEKEDEEIYPLIVPIGGIRLAFVNFTYGSNMGPDSKWPKVNLMNKEDISKAMQRAKEKGADYIIALPHWGIEYQLTHSTSQMNMAKWLVDEGADVILGAHPHVVQDTCRIEGVPVVFSMGNAVSNMSIINSRLELAVTLNFLNNGDGTSRMLEPKIEFLWCTLPVKLTDSYATIAVKDFEGRRDEWIEPSDYDNMMATYRRVKEATGIED